MKEAFNFNQRFTLSLAEFEQLTQSYSSFCEQLNPGQSKESTRNDGEVNGKKTTFSFCFLAGYE